MSTAKHFALKYLREEALPTPFCAGCGNGIITDSFLKAVKDLGHENLRKFAFVSGIGCGAWIPSPHFQADTLHTTHGRAVAFATGLKMSRPELQVVVISGDGDLATIGGNHLIHAARRNIDMTVIMSNNHNYGMTGGQVSATTFTGDTTSTTPYGNPERPFDISRLVAAAGANFVARWTTAHPNQAARAIKTALQREGFSFVEILSQCPTAYGRRAKIGKPKDFIDWYKKLPIRKKDAPLTYTIPTRESIDLGVFVDRNEPGFKKAIDAMTKRAQE
ncbi:2-oxoacid:ferredoxin oxidoreductase subunit beta [Candidatus Thorarchaeota archaeon]|nr:MAG: 2-oxoacid:ferredoxin oxidoreductase subunit beta [Candidatus Thorarchaeota archaeon]